MQLKFKIFIIIFLTGFNFSLGDNVYKYKIENIKALPSGKNVIAKHNGDTNFVTYYLNYIFTNGNEKIDIAVNDSVSTGILLNNTRIIAATGFEKSLLAISEENGLFFLYLINQKGEIKLKYQFYESKIPIDFEKLKVIEIIYKSVYLLSIDNKLIRFEFDNNLKVKSNIIGNIEGELFDIDNKAGFSKTEYFIVEESNNGIIVNLYDHQGNFLFLSKLVAYNNRKWIDIGSQLAFMSSPVSNQTFVQIIDKNDGIVTANFWLDVNLNLISLQSDGNTISSYYISHSNDGYYLNHINISNENKKQINNTNRLPDILTNPISLLYNEEKLIILTSNAISVFDNGLNIIGLELTNLARNFDNLDENHLFRSIVISDKIYLYSGLSGLKFTVTENKYWIYKKILSEFQNYLVIIILSILLLIFVQLYRHQRRINRELLELPTVGLLFVVDSVGRLTQINDSAMEFLEINKSTPLRKFFRFYTQNAKTSPLAEMIDKVMETGDNHTQKVTIMGDDGESEWLCKAIALRNLTGMFRGVVLSAVDITEQLERKRLSNWAQLAHDMQTNLSTIKLNAEHLDIELSENNKNRQKRIIFQVNLLMQRVRDIVTVGRSDKLSIESASVMEICNAVRNEFDDLMFPNVKFKIEAANYNIICDRSKLIRALRNAAENGIKALKGNEGLITISAWKSKGYSFISIEDNGAGMDEEIRKKMLTPYFTTAAKTGGSGIGTMIMQHVAELHKGSIIVESEKGIGTKIIFKLPDNMV